MSFRTLLICLTLAIAAQAAERDVTRTFAVGPGCTLKVDLDRGRINVEETDGSEVRVAIHAEAGADTDQEAEHAVQGLQFDLTVVNNTVAVRGRAPSETGWHIDLGDPTQLDIFCKISVPRRCNVELNTGQGAITVGNLIGRVFARTETGTIFVRRIEGAVDAATESGDVIVSRCLGPATLRTLRGVIRAGTLGARANLTNTTGDIEVLAARAGITAQAEAGDVTVGYPRDLTGDSDIRTSGGNIIVKIDPAANATIEASSIWGRVECKLPLTGESGGNGRSKFSSRLNRGGPVLKLHANGGNVSLLPGETLFE
jgi:hypothetical protein